MGVLIAIYKKTLCEWKGEAKYFYIKSTDGRISKKSAWTYNSPSNDFIKIKGYVAVYPSSVDQCLLDHEELKSQDGDFYGAASPQLSWDHLKEQLALLAGKEN